MFSRAVRQRLASAATRRSPVKQPQRRWITPAPKPGDGPLMSRRADRELPHLEQVTFRWGRTLPIFLVIVTISSVAIFNYQKSSSPVTAGTLYALRTNPRARALLGDDIYFKHQIPWIHGEMNQLHGRINIWFTVKGTKSTAVMRFASHRKTARGVFETTEWSLEGEDGTVIDLLEEGDPFRNLMGDDDDFVIPVAAQDEDAIRGFRQQPPLNR
ncbi:cytochrome oxidase assembly [Emericellopsis atlantica]|uniref:Cytochrome oxidase assembly n=1 Tax=Emericellopsis atlantica TaxID=2614577 RepID=A0A9P7ZQN5_9HYPO|nr:cytochrome oxidase assembly [Emericellopsis atlantica]KAG9256331.1 cytochrome oxidase assembly [Emericellopsis atlantica]